MLGFVYDVERPFDNNLAEQDARMVKVKQKISSCFRSAEWAAMFARPRGCVLTAKEQGRNVMEALSEAIAGRPFDLSLTHISTHILGFNSLDRATV